MLLASIALVPIAILGCAVALIVRFRRSRGTERLQLKWLTTAAATVATIYFFAMAISFNQSWGGEDTPYWISIVQNVAFLSFVLIPLAMAFAILRYRLYDIDLIINRTLVYGALTAILGAAYVLIVTVAGTILQGSDIVTAVATLSVAGLFRPLRRRIQGFIDRRFYRRRYDAARTMEAFTGSLRNEVDLEAMRLELLAAVHETLRPRRVSLWLKSGS
jgi:hypothetical protein